jgi:hypothetical protein
LAGALIAASGVAAQEARDDAPHRQAARAEALEFDEVHARFADRWQHDTVEHVWRFENKSPAAVRVVETVVVSGTAEIAAEPLTVPPGGTGRVTVRQALGDRLGESAFRYAIVTDEAGGARYRFTLSGFVQSAYDPESPALDFGFVDRTTGGTAEFELFSREVDRVVVTGVEGAPAWLAVTEPGRAGVAGEGAVVLGSLAPGAPEGYVSGTVTLKTNVAHQPEINLSWRAIVAGDVVPTENPLDLGIADIGVERQTELRLLSRSGRPFSIARLEADDAFSFADGPCPGLAGEQAALCRNVSVRWTPRERQRLGGAIRVYVAGQADPITVRYRGLAVPPGTEIRDLTPLGMVEDTGR